jgi:uncharacterized tellurite resistance protein B-like protein
LTYSLAAYLPKTRDKAMNIKKYIKKMTAHLNVEKRKSLSRKKYIKIILKELKKRERTLEEEISPEKDVKRRKLLKEELDITHQQRKKGIKALREIKKEA